jgi:hypothetical protein
LDGWRASNEVRLRTNEAQLAKADARKEQRLKLNDDLALAARGDHLAGRCNLVRSELSFGNEGLRLI